MEITLTSIEKRLCKIDDDKALFHKWITRKQVISPSPMIGGHPGGELQFEFAIVEFEDGTIQEVAPHRIKFIDGLVKNIYQQCAQEGERWKKFY